MSAVATSRPATTRPAEQPAARGPGRTGRRRGRRRRAAPRAAAARWRASRCPGPTGHEPGPQQRADGGCGDVEQQARPQPEHEDRDDERRPDGGLVAGDVVHDDGPLPAGVARALGHPAHDHQQVGGGEHGAEAGDRHEHEVQRPVERRVGAERAEHRQHLAPEPGQAGQAEARRCRRRRAGRRGAAAARTARGRSAVEVDGAVPVLDRADEEEQQAGDEAVRDVGEQRAVDAGLGERREAEQHEAHVADAGVGDQPLEVASAARQAREP